MGTVHLPSALYNLLLDDLLTAPALAVQDGVEDRLVLDLGDIVHEGEQEEGGQEYLAKLGTKL